MIQISNLKNNNEISLSNKMGIFFLLTLSPIIWLLIACQADLQLYSLIYLVVGFGLNTIIQFAALKLIYKLLSPSWKWLITPVIVLVLVINLRFNILYLISSSLNQKIIIVLIFSVIAILSLRSKAGLKFAAIFSFLLLTQSTISQLQLFFKSETFKEQQVSSSNEEKSSAIKNIYFIGLDSLPNDEYYQHNFGAVPVWSTKFEDAGFRKISQSQTDGGISTRSFYFNLLSLESRNLGDETHYLHSQNLLNRPLPFYSLVKRHHYRSQFMFHSPWLGNGKNTFFDYSYPTKDQSNTLCPFLTPNVGFYLCQEKVVRFIDIILKGKLPTLKDLNSGGDTSIADMMPVLFDRIKIAANDTSPWISIFHLWEPGHTTADYRHNNAQQKLGFQNTFRDRALNATQDALNIVEQIKKLDQDPIIIISGDHGPYLSQGWELDSSIRGIFSEKERLEDTQGIGLFVYPKDFCTKKIQNRYKIPPLFSDIMECLTNTMKVVK